MEEENSFSALVVTYSTKRKRYECPGPHPNDSEDVQNVHDDKNDDEDSPELSSESLSQSQPSMADEVQTGILENDGFAQMEPMKKGFSLNGVQMKQLLSLGRKVCLNEDEITPFKIYETGVSMDDAEVVMKEFDVDQNGKITLEDFHVQPSQDDANLHEETNTGDGNGKGNEEGTEGGSNGEEVPSDSPLLEIPGNTQTFVAAGYFISLVYLFCFGCICFSCAKCVKNGTVVLYFVALLITFVVVHNNSSFCDDKDLVTCMSSFFFSNSIASILLILVYIGMMYFSKGTIFWDMLALPLGIFSSGITIAGGCGNVHTSFMGSDTPTPPICNQLKSMGETMFFCTGNDCLSVVSKMPIAPLTIVCVALWIAAICMLTYYLTQEEDEDDNSNNGSSETKAEKQKNRRLSTQLEQKEKEVATLQRRVTDMSQSQNKGPGGWGQPGGNNNNNNNSSSNNNAAAIAGKDNEIHQLKLEKQQEQQRANQAVYQLEQMKVNVDTLGQEKEQVENGWMQTQQQLTKSKGVLKQVTERFEHLKSQNVMLQQKLMQVKTLSLADVQSTNQFDGQVSSTFPNTPSA